MLSYLIYTLENVIIQHVIKIVKAAASDENKNISDINIFSLEQCSKLLYINVYGITVPNNNDIISTNFVTIF